MYLIRLLVIGDTGVGKTSLLLRFYDETFSATTKSTIGVDYKAKEVIIGSETVKLQIWDTAGQERFRSMTAAFFGKAQGAVVVFDVSDLDSFEHLTQWIEDIHKSAPADCSIVICANKVDLPPDRWQVSREMFENYSQSSGYPLIETSASNGKNINEVFYSKHFLLVSTASIFSLNIILN